MVFCLLVFSLIADIFETTNHHRQPQPRSRLVFALRIHAAQTMQATNNEGIPICDQPVHAIRRTFCHVTTGEVCLTNDELKASPPHRAEHKVARHPARSGDGAKDSGNTLKATNPRLRKTRTKRGPGGGHPSGMGATGSPATLALAVQVSWPEDPESAEGKLVRDLQNEQGLLSTRVEALKVKTGQGPNLPLCCTIRLGSRVLA